MTIKQALSDPEIIVFLCFMAGMLILSYWVLMAQRHQRNEAHKTPTEPKPEWRKIQGAKCPKCNTGDVFIHTTASKPHDVYGEPVYCCTPDCSALGTADHFDAATSEIVINWRNLHS